MQFIRSILGGFLFCAILALGARAADEPAGAEAARAVIQSQLEAFRKQSVEEAYGFAAPNIQRIFPTPERFGSMVENGYPMVWNPAKADFLDAVSRGDLIVQRLRFVDQAGRAYIAEYAMVMVNGVWRIAGVEIKEDVSYGA